MRERGRRENGRRERKSPARERGERFIPSGESHGDDYDRASSGAPGEGSHGGHNGWGTARGEGTFGAGSGAQGSSGFGWGGAPTGYGESGSLEDGPYRAQRGQGGYGAQWGTPSGTRQGGSPPGQGRDYAHDAAHPDVSPAAGDADPTSAGRIRPRKRRHK